MIGSVQLWRSFLDLHSSRLSSSCLLVCLCVREMRVIRFNVLASLHLSQLTVFPLLTYLHMSTTPSSVSVLTLFIVSSAVIAMILTLISCNLVCDSTVRPNQARGKIFRIGGKFLDFYGWKWRNFVHSDSYFCSIICRLPGERFKVLAV